MRALVALLLLVAAAGAIATSANASALGRLFGMLAALVAGIVGVGVIRQRPWAFGSASVLGLIWLWTVIALRIHGSMSPLEFLLWLAWALVMITASIRAWTGLRGSSVRTRARTEG